ncbi:MAG: hypothetical protein IIB11_06990 [Chloroflexi bacterium]|nr:hypothetical protein [Chloroflexota bacterium]
MKVGLAIASGFGERGHSSANPSAFRFAAARHFVLAMATAVFLWEAFQVFWMAQPSLFRGAVGICLIAMLVPVMVWASNREKHLSQLIEERERQLAQRSKELKALNRLFQTHLAEQFRSETSSREGSAAPSTAFSEARAPIHGPQPQPSYAFGDMLGFPREDPVAYPAGKKA